jgi:hypothetical protein
VDADGVLFLRFVALQRIGPDFLNPFFELFPVDLGLVFHLGPVVVNGIGRVAQEMGNLITVGNAEPDQGKNPELGGKKFSLFGQNGLPGFEQSVEPLHKIGKQLEEDSACFCNSVSCRATSSLWTFF